MFIKLLQQTEPLLILQDIKNLKLKSKKPCMCKVFYFQQNQFSIPNYKSFLSFRLNGPAPRFKIQSKFSLEICPKIFGKSS